MSDIEQPTPQRTLAQPDEEIAREVVPVSIDEETKSSYLLYSMSVITSRALPDVRDGLKPVQRRLLRAMDDLNLGPGAAYRKSAKITGDTNANYHPHGTQVIYPTLVRMAQVFNARYPLVDGQGNMGSVDGDEPAAERYTEVRMSPYAVEMLADIDMNTVDFIGNYDQSRTEPTVLPARLPNLLCNGSSGIAVGMATSIPPHNLTEICDGLTYLIDNPHATVDELMQFIKGPDFPTHGLLLGTKGIRQAYETGRGPVVMQARTEFEPLPNGKTAIIVTELPYQVNKAKLIQQIAALVKEKKVDGITDLNDFSDKRGMRMVIELRRDAQPKKVLNYLLKHTPLRQTFGILMLALVKGQPRVLTLPQILQHWIEHREEIIRRRTQFELDRALARAHILEGYLKALDVLDEIIAIIRSSRSPENARTQLVERFEFTTVQAQAILELQLQRLTGMERQKIEEEHKELIKRIGYLEQVLADIGLVRGIIKTELKQLKDRLGDQRRTRIVPIEADQIGEEDIIPEEETIITLSRTNYIKRLPIDTFRSQKRGGRGIIGATSKQEDELKHIFVATTHDFILFFTDRGRVYKLKAYDIPQTARTSQGQHVVNLLGLQAGETVTSTIPVKDLQTEGYFVMGTELGEVKRTALTEFRNLRVNGLNAFDIEPNDTLRWVQLTSGRDEVLLVTQQGLSIRFPESDLRASGRGSGGVRGISVQPGDRVVGMDIARDGGDVLVVSQNGFGKRTTLDAYRGQKRGGKGIISMRVTGKTGPIADIKVVGDSDRLLVMTRNGIIIRINVNDLRRIGRATEGVKIINVHEGDIVANIERVPEAEKSNGRAATTSAVDQEALALATGGNGAADDEE
jgi:DNA gyrase subunit A